MRMGNEDTDLRWINLMHALKGKTKAGKVTQQVEASRFTEKTDP